MQDFKIGDKVLLKSDNTPMTITALNDDKNKALCAWFDSSHNLYMIDGRDFWIECDALALVTESVQQNEPIQAGSTVKLRSDGPYMVVGNLVPAQNNNFIAVCYWTLEKGELQRHRFPIQALVPAQRPQLKDFL